MSYEPTVWVDGDHVTSAKLNKLEQGVNSMSYTPTVWNAGDVVTAEKLNKLEQGVAEGGGGGMAIPTVTLDVENMTYTCDVGYDGWYSLLENSIYEDEGDKTYPVWCLETGNIHGTFAVSYLFSDVDGIFASVNEGYGFIFHNDGTIEKSE